MSSTSGEPHWAVKFLAVALGCILAFFALKYLLIGGSMVAGWVGGMVLGAFKGAFDLGFSSITTIAWLQTLVQITASIVIALVAVSLAYRFSFVTVRTVVIQYQQFKSENQEAIRTFKRQTPPLVYSAGIFAQICAIFATGVLPDTTFTEKVYVVAFGSILIIPGWVSNQLLGRAGKWERAFGWGFWLLCILAVPTVVWLASKGDIHKAQTVLQTHPEILVLTGLIILLTVVAPRMIGSVRDEE